MRAKVVLIVTEVSIRRTGAESQYPRRTRMLTYGVSRLEEKKVEHLWNLAMSNAKEVQWVQTVQEGMATDGCRMAEVVAHVLCVPSIRGCSGLMWFSCVPQFPGLEAWSWCGNMEGQW